jgi:DNA-binding CsgD family transcriptional regulator
MAVYRARGQASETLGEFEAARADYEAALALARSSLDQHAEWQALLDLGMLWAARDHDRAGEYYQHALGLARGMDDAALVAQSLNRVGNWYVNGEQPLEGLRYHDEALAVFRRLGDRAGLAQTQDLLGMANLMRGDLVRSAGHYLEAIALFRELDDRQGLISSLASLVICNGSGQADTNVAAASDRDEFIRGADAALRLARDMGWRSAEAYVLFQLAYSWGLSGHLARALECGRSAVAIAEEIEHGEWLAAAHSAVGLVLLNLVALPEARGHLERGFATASEIGSLLWLRVLAGFLTAVCVAQGDTARAEAALAAAIGQDTPMETLGQRGTWCACAELALHQGDAGRALEIADRLIASAANTSTERPVPRLWKLRGEALAALGRVAEAESALVVAREAAEAQGERARLWRIHAALGKLYLAERRREAAQHELAQARAVIGELAADIPDESLRLGFVRGATATLPSAPAPSPRSAAKQAYGGLTQREREVVVHIAQGRSNRAIAEKLVVSERTVETHVENIMSKLGFASRTQIAAWAVEKGLVGIT